MKKLLLPLIGLSLLVYLIISCEKDKDDREVVEQHIIASEGTNIKVENFRIEMLKNSFDENLELVIQSLNENEIPEGVPEHEQIWDLYEVEHQSADANKPIKVSFDYNFLSMPSEPAIIRYDGEEWMILDTKNFPDSNQIVAYSPGLSIFGFITGNKTEFEGPAISHLDYVISFGNELRQDIDVQCKIFNEKYAISTAICKLEIKTTFGEYKKLLAQIGNLAGNTSYALLASPFVKNNRLVAQFEMSKQTEHDFFIRFESAFLQGIHDLENIQDIRVSIIAENENGDKSTSGTEYVHFHYSAVPALTARSPIEYSGIRPTLRWDIKSDGDWYNYEHQKVILSTSPEPFNDNTPVATKYEVFDAGVGNLLTSYKVPNPLKAGTQYFWEARICQNSRFNNRDKYFTTGVISFIPTNEIYITYPDKSTEWETGKKYTITWYTNDYLDNVSLTLFPGDGTPTIIARSTENDGSFDYLVPKELETGDAYVILLKKDNSINHLSDQFAIHSSVSLPEITTSVPNNIETYSANLGGNVVSDGNASILERGVYYGTLPKPEINGKKYPMGSGKGNFSSTISGLSANTTYYVKAYCTNSKGTAYGNTLNFKTGIVKTKPEVSTSDASMISTNSALLGGSIINDGGADILVKGVFYGTRSNPQITGTKINIPSNNKDFSKLITGLAPGTRYFFTAFAQNETGIGYGLPKQFYTEKNTTKPTVSSKSYSVSENSAVLGGIILSDGGESITEKGIYYSTSQNPLSGGNKVVINTQSDQFSDAITGLSPNTGYYFTAFATNINGTSYGHVLNFITKKSLSKPTVTTDNITEITTTSAMARGKILSDGGASIISNGVCWGTSQNPTTSDQMVTGNTEVWNMSLNMPGLQPNTTYYVRAFASNSEGISYGNQLSFTTGQAITIPVINTEEARGITDTQANLSGNLVSNGGSQIISMGVCWSTSPNPTTSDRKMTTEKTSGSFYFNLYQFQPNTTYYVRAFAENSLGIAYGNEVSFTTAILVTPPTVSTTPISNIGINSATSGGNVSSDGGATVSLRGICWSTSPTPTIYNAHTVDGSGTGSFTSVLSELSENTTYYVRAYASNNKGTSYGNQLSFTTGQNITPPAVTTDPVSNIGTYTAVAGGNVTSDGGAAVTEKGVCWSTSPNPTKENTRTFNGTGTGSFSGTIYELSANTTYYIRAYATNSAGTTYGNQRIFTTEQVKTIPSITTYAVTNIGTNSATASANITSDGGATVTSRGICWGTSPYPTQVHSYKTNGSGTGSFSVTLDELSANTTYYVRAFAINSEGTAYANQVSFTTQQNLSPPSVTTSSVYNIGTGSATSGGNVTSDGGATVTSRGICWGTSSNPTLANAFSTDGNGTGSFTSSLVELSANTTYYVRAYATNSQGTTYGNQRSFTTQQILSPPTVTTTMVYNITTNSATSGGNVTSDGGAPLSERGVCWSTSSNPTKENAHTYDGTSTGKYTSQLVELSANTTYYVRAYASNSQGTSYGNQVSFTTPQILSAPTVSTTPAYNIGTHSATSGGNVTSDGGAAITERGVCWSTWQYPTKENSHTFDGTSTGSFSSSLVELSSGTTYYVRAYASNSQGTTYGNQIEFTTDTESCNSPSNPGVSSITQNSAYLDWSSVSNAYQYTLRYRSTSSLSWIYEHPSSSNFSLSELSSSTTYEWQVMSICGADWGSSWMSGPNFTTASGRTCYNGLPNPILSVESAQIINADGTELLRVEFDVNNYSSFPNDLFTAAPDLPPCGWNTNSSRTWVDIYDANHNHLNGFCGLDQSSDLNEIWFNRPPGEIPSRQVYIVIWDRGCNISYTSNMVSF